MEIKNKRFNFLGDSITEGCGTTCEDKIFLNVMKEKYGLASANNYGIGGTRIAHQQTPSHVSMNEPCYCCRYRKMNPNADFVIVFGGTNDFGHGNAPLGSFDDRTPDTFYGACHTLMSGLLDMFTKSTIVFMTPLHRLMEDSLYGDNNRSFPIAPLSEYVKIIKEVAQYYSIPVLDLYSMSGIQPNVPAIRRAYCPDGLHPNDAGHAIIADRLANFLLGL